MARDCQGLSDQNGTKSFLGLESLGNEEMIFLGRMPDIVKVSQRVGVVASAHNPHLIVER